jgi:hypothetical protein
LTGKVFPVDITGHTGNSFPPLEPGAYTCIVEVDGQKVKELPFTIGP